MTLQEALNRLVSDGVPVADAVDALNALGRHRVSEAALRELREGL